MLPRPMPAVPRKILIVVTKQLPEAVVCHKYLAVVPRPLPAAPFLVHIRSLIVVSRPLPAAALVVRRTHLNVVPRPVPRPMPAATQCYRSRRRALGRRAEEQSLNYLLHLHRGKVW